MPYTAVMYSSASEMWATPQKTFDALHAEFDFTLDAAAVAENTKCPKFFSPDDDALTKNWGGRTGILQSTLRKAAAAVD